MKIYLLDDDLNILLILEKIITDRQIGEVCGYSVSSQDALEDLRHTKPDIMILDLLMPEIDGITFLKQASLMLPDCSFVMISQVSTKDMIADAYSSGVEFYIQKPLNSIEVETVLRNVIQKKAMQRTLSMARDLFQLPERDSAAPSLFKTNADAKQEPYILRAKAILRSLGILGEHGSQDILTLLRYIHEHDGAAELSLGQLCSLISDNPKSAEQRIRRTATTGLINLANLGLEDYSNDVFTEYANTLYNFEQVRKEMNCIRGKSIQHGNVKIKSFLNALLSYCQGTV